MKDMANLYRKMPTFNLQVLRSVKFERKSRLESYEGGFFNKREIEVLAHQIHQIDVELAARFYQMPLP